MDTGFSNRKVSNPFSALMGGQIIEELYANIPHTQRDDIRGARISQQKTVLIS